MKHLMGSATRGFFAVVAMLLMLSGAVAVTGAEAESFGAVGSSGLVETVSGGQASITGAWRVESYILRDGGRPPVDGSILFTESGWAVLFFIVDEEGEPRRGSGEGGTYTLDGDQLTFFHRFNMSGGDAVEGFAASDWSLTLREPDAAVDESCTVDLSDERLTIHFPSGNRMEFSRSSR